jgi:hypothetical protein
MSFDPALVSWMAREQVRFGEEYAAVLAFNLQPRPHAKAIDKVFVDHCARVDKKIRQECAREVLR